MPYCRTLPVKRRADAFDPGIRPRPHYNPIDDMSKPDPIFRLIPGKRVLFLTKDPELIRRQLRGELDLKVWELDAPGDLLDDINTDVMTPAWVCFRHKPEDIALDAYAGLIDAGGKRAFEQRALYDGGFQVIVSGQRKGTGSSRETAPQAEKWCGIELVIASSFAPIHAQNNVNLGQLMGGYEVLARLQAGEEIPLAELTAHLDPVSRAVMESGGLFAFAKRRATSPSRRRAPGSAR
jgi:3-isopropylmalate/(R)-2-methylmalate dehydratase large subunit